MVFAHFTMQLGRSNKKRLDQQVDNTCTSDKNESKAGNYLLLMFKWTRNRFLHKNRNTKLITAQLK